MAFTKAVKGKKPLRLVLGGPSGAGKTFTALTFAKFLEEELTHKPTGAIDTEHYRMSMYADRFNFDVNNFEPPFDPRELMKQIREAEKAGYGQMIVDSSTHFYSGEGGLLQIVQDAAKTKYGGNQYAGWGVGTPIQNELVDTIIRSPMHMIFCSRAKQGYLETEKNGRKTYEKAGMELQNRDGFEYDFDFFLMMDMDNNGLVEKGMGHVPTGAYLKKPDSEAISLIMRSINENTVESSAIPAAPVSLSSLQDTAIAIIQELGGRTNEKLMAVLNEFDPSCNPKKVKDVGKIQTLIVNLESMKNNPQ